MALPEPYYRDEAVTLYHGDCRDILPEVDPATVALVIADPPYGINERCDRLARGRSGPKSRCNDFPRVAGDDEPFDPAHLLRFRRLVLFGANHYADRLPPSPSWIVWDKLDGLESGRDIGFNDQADVEMIWTNLGGPARLIPHRWMGALKNGSERDKRRAHPTQKPVAIFERIIAAHTNPGDLVVDPYCGSGPVPRACKNLGRRCIAVELVADYCRKTVSRLAQSVLPLEIPA
jgi:site-specific DNA-methyltransferase (adenine-specific)